MLKILIIYGVIAILVMQRANQSCHVKSGGNFSQIFKRVFLETTFANTFDMISQVLMNRLTWNLAWTFFIYPSIVRSRIM